MGRKAVVLVVGLDRSGTSATARVLSRLGVDMVNPRGEDHCHPTENPTGYYEDPAVNKDLEARRYDRAVRGWVDRNRSKEIWGLKDPRLAWPDNLEGVLKEIHLGDFERRVLIVATHRPASAITLSRAKCGAPVEHDVVAQIIRLKDKKLIELQRAGYKVHNVNFDSLIENPITEASRLAAFTDLDYRDAAAHAVVPSLRHFK